MTLRISTAGLHAQGLQGLLKRQQEVARTQNEMVTGNKLTRAAENPAGAAQAQRIDHAVAMLDGFERSATLLEGRLQLQEEALSDTNDLLTRARELAIQGNNAPLSSAERKMIAAEIRHLRSDMIAAANRSDGNGRALFAGRVDGVTPFADVGGSVRYDGDDGRNLHDVAPDLAIADADPGSDVFLRVRTGNGEIRATAGASNTGTGLLQETVITDHAAWPASPLRIEFTAADAYRVLDDGGAVIATGTFAPGDAIAVAGVRTRIAGVPATGDAFTVEPAPVQDVFATLERLADALEMPVTPGAVQARQTNLIGNAIADIATAQDHMLALRASTGARRLALDNAAETRAGQSVTLRENLSQLRDVDYAEATGRLGLQLTAIEAAQRTMLRVQGLSLFDKLG